MLAKELLSYNVDIICLQECDKKVFDTYLDSLLKNNGFLGHYTNKSSNVLEGCATFTKGLRVLRRIDLPVKNILRNATYIEKIFHERPDIRDIIGTKIGTIGQITLCQILYSFKLVICFSVFLLDEVQGKMGK
jgi:mRNA deadenylase 3'-5' endonuclease subunit Ccr4